MLRIRLFDAFSRSLYSLFYLQIPLKIRPSFLQKVHSPLRLSNEKVPQMNQPLLMRSFPLPYLQSWQNSPSQTTQQSSTLSKSAKSKVPLSVYGNQLYSFPFPWKESLLQKPSQAGLPILQQSVPLPLILSSLNQPSQNAPSWKISFPMPYFMSFSMPPSYCLPYLSKPLKKLVLGAFYDLGFYCLGKLEETDAF